MTTDYLIQRQQDLRDHKKLMREAEVKEFARLEEEKELRRAVSDVRIAVKQARISGDPVPQSATVKATISPPLEVLTEPVAKKGKKGTPKKTKAKAKKSSKARK